MIMTDNIDVFRTMAALVRAFFEALTEGVMSGRSEAETGGGRFEPKAVKQAMLDHYGDIGNAFFDTMFYILARLNHERMDDIRKTMSSLFKDHDPTVPELMRLACGSDALYDAMVEEYKRNFGLLLCGTLSKHDEHIAAYTRGDSAQAVGRQTAVRLLVRTLVRAYASGLQLSGCGMSCFSQTVVLRMMIENINLLVNESHLDISCDSIDDMLLSACGSETCMNVALNEMGDLCNELCAARTDKHDNAR